MAFTSRALYGVPYKGDYKASKGLIRPDRADKAFVIKGLITPKGLIQRPRAFFRRGFIRPSRAL